VKKRGIPRRSADSAPIDTHLLDDIIGSVPEEKARRVASRYDAVVATFVGVCALCVSGYTAYMQRQQVRAVVWPILEFDSNNGPIEFILSNKGVGPAIVKHVIVRVDGQPVRNWIDALAKLAGPGEPHYAESDMNGRVLAPGERIAVFTPHDATNNPLNFDKSNPVWVKLNTRRLQLSVEICYCSTLGECWKLRAGGGAPSTTTECRRCPRPSEVSFQQ